MIRFATFFISFYDEGEAQEDLNDFLRSHRILNVEKHLTEKGWAFCVEWMEDQASSPKARSARERKGAVDYRELLSPEVFARYAKLREKRNAIAKANGLASYVVMTNDQLAELAKQEAPSMETMKPIAGIGESRIARYGAALLEALQLEAPEDISQCEEGSARGESK